MCTHWISNINVYTLNTILNVHVFLNLEKKKQSLKIDPGTKKKRGKVECNKTITALHWVQYDV